MSPRLRGEWSGTFTFLLYMDPSKRHTWTSGLPMVHPSCQWIGFPAQSGSFAANCGAKRSELRFLKSRLFSAGDIPCVYDPHSPWIPGHVSHRRIIIGGDYFFSWIKKGLSPYGQAASHSEFKIRQIFCPDDTEPDFSGGACARNNSPFRPFILGNSFWRRILAQAGRNIWPSLTRPFVPER